MPVIFPEGGGVILRFGANDQLKINKIMWENGIPLDETILQLSSLADSDADSIWKILARVARHVETGNPKYYPNPRRKIQLRYLKDSVLWQTKFVSFTTRADSGEIPSGWYVISPITPLEDYGPGIPDYREALAYGPFQYKAALRLARAWLKTYLKVRPNKNHYSETRQAEFWLGPPSEKDLLHTSFLEDGAKYHLVIDKRDSSLVKKIRVR